MVLEGSLRPRLTSLVSLDLVEAHEGSGIGISRSSAGTVLASVTTPAIWMERSAASTRARLYLVGVGDGELARRARTPIGEGIFSTR